MKPLIKLDNNNFRGSWAGMPVAWNARNQFDERAYRADLARCCRLGVPGVYTGGTTGEFYAMEIDEFKHVVKATVEEAHAAGKPAMIGVSSTYTLGAARRAAYAAELGADAIQLPLPFWMEVPAEAIVDFFQEVSAASGHLPLSIYDTRRSKIGLTLEQHRAVKSAIPNYLMVKSTGDTLGCSAEGCAALTAMGINVFCDEALHWGKLGQHGVVGSCSSFVYYAPNIVMPLNQALAAKDWAKVAEGSTKLQRLLDFIGEKFDPLGYLDAAGDKLGGVAGGVLHSSLYSRGPYPHATDKDVQTMREWYRVNLPEVYATIPAMQALP